MCAHFFHEDAYDESDSLQSVEESNSIQKQIILQTGGVQKVKG